MEPSSPRALWRCQTAFVTRLWEFSAGELASLIRTRTASSEEVVNAHLERIAAVNPDLRAVVQLRGEAALAEACAADRVLAEGEHLGPLHGVPFTVKDWIETHDLPCAAGFERRRDYIPHRDASSSLTITQAYWARPESMDLEDWRPYGPSKLTADEVERSLFEWDRFRRSMLGFMADYDVVLSPAAEGSAPLADAPVTGETYRYTLPYSLTGQPVALVRAGTSGEGLPLGVQIASGNWRDHLAVAGARFLEAAPGPWDIPLREP
jgi:Asp-tRNA(Asn)/Glu-tRNA(Gln) amidotransferase A subunit family amidase